MPNLQYEDERPQRPGEYAGFVQRRMVGVPFQECRECAALVMSTDESTDSHREWHERVG